MPGRPLASLESEVAGPEPRYRWEDVGLRLEAGEWTGNALNCALTLSRSLTEVTGMKLLRRPTIKDKKKSLKEWTFQFVEYYKLNLATYFDKASCRIC